MSAVPDYGELFLLVNPRGRRSLRRLTRGQDVHGADGVIPAEILAGTDFGSEVRTLLGAPYRLMRPTLF
ncbi:MAG: tRNA (adenine-N1)-methyltransferase, partial [Deltaproteobacteria bacterium]|nr:tRNA (adenine-N1)-methyltransferase [Deltaproteobacteria bacterium]